MTQLRHNLVWFPWLSEDVFEGIGTSKFLDGLLLGNIDFPELLSLILFRIPQRSSCSVTLFYDPFASTNFFKNEPIRCTNANIDP